MVAAGVPGLVTADMVKPGAAVLDVGITRTEAGLTGDVDPGVREVAGWLAPMPGGVGPMTRAMLLANVVESAEKAPEPARHAMAGADRYAAPQRAGSLLAAPARPSSSRVLVSATRRPRPSGTGRSDPTPPPAWRRGSRQLFAGLSPAGPQLAARRPGAVGLRVVPGGWRRGLAAARCRCRRPVAGRRDGVPSRACGRPAAARGPAAAGVRGPVR